MEPGRTLSFTLAQSIKREARLDETVEAALVATGLREIGHAYVLDLQSMRYGAWREGSNVYPASVIKVPIMAEAFRQFQTGSIRPDDTVMVAESNQTTTWGVSPFTAGAAATVAELVDRMITHSDNVATNQLMDLLHRERVTASMHELGLPTFFLGRKLSGSEPLIKDPGMTGRNCLPPNEVAALLALIAMERVPGAAAQREIMSRCVHSDKLAQSLRRGDVFMHKTGETSEQSHDAGILETADGKRYIVVLYTTPPPKPDHSDADHVNPQMAQWMRIVRDAL